MDLSYITALLKDGFGFADSTVLQARERAEESHNRHLGVGKKELRVTIGAIMRIFIQAMDKHCARHYESGKLPQCKGSF